MVATRFGKPSVITIIEREGARRAPRSCFGEARRTAAPHVPCAHSIIAGDRRHQRRDASNCDAPVFPAAFLSIDFQVTLAISLSDEVLRRNLVILGQSVNDGECTLV